MITERSKHVMVGTMRTLLDVENAILDIFEKNMITFDGAKTALWQLLRLSIKMSWLRSHSAERLLSQTSRDTRNYCLLIFWDRDDSIQR